MNTKTYRAEGINRQVINKDCDSRGSHLPVAPTHFCETQKCTKEAHDHTRLVSPCHPTVPIWTDQRDHSQLTSSEKSRVGIFWALSICHLVQKGLGLQSGQVLHQDTRHPPLRDPGLWVQWRGLKDENVNVCLQEEGLCRPSTCQTPALAVVLNLLRKYEELKLVFPSYSGIFLDTNCGAHPVSWTGRMTSQHRL